MTSCVAVRRENPATSAKERQHGGQRVVHVGDRLTAVENHHRPDAAAMLQDLDTRSSMQLHFRRAGAALHPATSAA